jgi:hypothetical protein
VAAGKDFSTNPNLPSRRGFLAAGVAGGVAVAARNAGAQEATRQSTATSSPATNSFELAELTLDDLNAAMQSGRATSRSLSEKYLAQIEA